MSQCAAHVQEGLGCVSVLVWVGVGGGGGGSGGAGGARVWFSRW